MAKPLSAKAFETLFTEARSFKHWKKKSVKEATLRRLVEYVNLAPTSVNCSPIRITFLKTKRSKNKLLPALMEGNRQQTIDAPITAIISFDMNFFEHLPTLFPYVDAKSWYVNDTAAAHETAFRNGSMQGGYFILAARALGLDCGPMSGFDNAAVDKLFFKGTGLKSNYICNIGYGDAENMHPRGPRLSFEQVAQIV